MTLLESGFPFRDVSRVVAADRRAVDPAYQAHRWWARRPPALLRAALLAAVMPSETTVADFWLKYGAVEPHLDGVVVRDPFLGGGTTLVEAARLGATVVAADVDPLAVTISEHQLNPAEPSDVSAAGLLLQQHLEARLGAFWPNVAGDDDVRWMPLHYFYVAKVTCPGCDVSSPLYRSLVLARSVGRPGAVVRESPVTAFCPDCYTVHQLDGDATGFDCCGVNHSLGEATFERRRFVCPACDTRSNHEQLLTGAVPRILVAVEDLPVGRRHGGRRIRAPRASDRSGATKATRWVADRDLRSAVAVPLETTEHDARPVSYGIATVDALHTDRQIAYLAEAFAWIAQADIDPAVARALRLAVSTTITCNNRLCGYATDYGRLAPLFSVRAFSLPWLTVELNPLHPSAGRGSLLNAVARVAKSGSDEVRRSVVGKRRDVVPVTMTVPRVREGHYVRCSDSTGDQVTKVAEPLADLCVTDPPYFDFIPYDALSQVFRVWTTDSALAGPPLHPVGADKVIGFGTALGAAFRQSLAGCKPDALLAFTYKGDDQAWQAVGVALDEAKLRVTALWPVLADPHMGHHSHEGNCEYDLLVVCRPVAATHPVDGPAMSVKAMLKELRKDRTVTASDETNLRTAVAMAAARWGSFE